MLHSLNPGERGLTGEYTAPDLIGLPNIATIDGTLSKLDTVHDRPALNTILQDTWRKYRNTPNFNIEKAKKVTLQEMITEIDKNENWMDHLIQFGKAEKSKDALQIIGQHPLEWANLPLLEIRKFFDPFDERRANLSPVSPEHEATMLRIMNNTKVNPGEDIILIMKAYLASVIDKDDPINTSLTFREFLAHKEGKAD